jgi:hypothetical protein
VFLGEDLMHTRDYSEDTSKIIDDEVERILRAEEERAMEVLPAPSQPAVVAATPGARPDQAAEPWPAPQWPRPAAEPTTDSPPEDPGVPTP